MNRRIEARPRTYQQVVTAIKDEGCTIHRSRHLKVYRPNGTFLLSLPCTPSDVRGARNAWASFRKAMQTSPR